MKQFSFCDFLEYYNGNYVTNNKKSAISTFSGLVNCVLSNRDPWFHILDSELYQLHLLGIEIEFINNGYYVYRNDSDNTSLCVGDRIQKINGHSIENIGEALHDRTYIILDCIDSCNMTPKRVEIQYPVCRSTLCDENHYLSISDTVGYLQINSFATFHSLAIDQVLQCEELFIDLRNCSGGPINDMIASLSNFSILDARMQLIVTRGDKSYAVCRIPFLNRSNRIKKINLIVGKSTASSAELFCILLNQYYLCEVYGNKTTGKLRIQDLVQVDDCIVAIPVYTVDPNINVGHYPGLVFEGDAIIPRFPLDSLPECIREIIGNVDHTSK